MTKRRLFVGILPALLVMAIYAPSASASLHGVELVPTPTAEVPTSFVGTISAPTGGILQLHPQEHSESQNVDCEKATISGSFTSRRRGTAQETYSGCRIEGSHSYPVHTAGAASEVIVSVKFPILLAARFGGFCETVKGYGVVVNPENGEGTHSTEFFPNVYVGNAVGGPLRGSMYANITSALNAKVKTATLGQLGGGYIYQNEVEYCLGLSPFEWTTFNGWKTGATLSGEATLQLGRESEFKTF